MSDLDDQGKLAIQNFREGSREVPAFLRTQGGPSPVLPAAYNPETPLCFKVAYQAGKGTEINGPI